jgi:hypothetical protein
MEYNYLHFALKFGNWNAGMLCRKNRDASLPREFSKHHADNKSKALPYLFYLNAVSFTTS